jgi:uncharacterized phage-associated protein
MKGKPMYTANQVAKFFIWKSAQENKKISNKKLQKLLYYAQSWYVTLKEKPLFEDKIEAWIHGPTVRSIYGKYKKFGFNPINIKINEKEISELQNEDLLNDVWKIYGKYDADYLEILTHNEKPWQLAREGLEFDDFSNAVISLDSMKDFYTQLLKDIENEQG